MQATEFLPYPLPPSYWVFEPPDQAASRYRSRSQALALSTTIMSSPTPSPAPSAQSPSTTSSTPSAPTSLTDDLDRLTTAIQQVGDEIATCKQESEERHNARLARDEQETQRTLSVQEQLAQMIAMTQESLRRRREEPVVGECFRSLMIQLG